MRVGTRVRAVGLVCLSMAMISVAHTPASAATIYVPSGGDLQAALNTAQAGDVITLEPGATYVGNFTLPNKGALGAFITIRSAAPDSALPPDGVRITPAYAAALPKIRSANSMSALRTTAATNHWKLMFLEFQANLSGYGDIIELGMGDSTQTQLAQVPYALVVDRVYVHGDPAMGQKRGIALNSSDTQILNSYISDCKAVGQDTQALGGFNGPGNYVIENNYLEAAAENFLLGGSDPPIPNLVTTNVTFRGNYLAKPIAWRNPIVATPVGVAAAAAPGGGTLASGTYFYKVVARAAAGQTNKANSTPSVEVSATIAAGTTGGVTISWTPVVGAADYVVFGRTSGSENAYWKTTNPFFTDTGAAGTSGAPGSATKWAVKNLFELKNAQDVLVEGNVFENLWVADQPGYPIVFTPRNQSGTAPWVVVQRVTFQHNLIRHTAGGVNILGTDNLAPSQLTNHITVHDNVFDDMGTAWGSGAKTVQIGDGGDSFVVDHNTFITTDTTVLALYGGTATAPTPITNVVYSNNMSEHRTYGIFGSSFATGLSSINAYLPGGVVVANVLAGGSASKYPVGNFFPTVLAWDASFVNYAAGDYHLLASSPYKNAGTDGVDLGADIDRIASETASAISGDNRLPLAAAAVKITTTALPDGMLNQSYAQPIACTGGSAPCVWRLDDSTLPAGVSFDAASGMVAGLPTSVQTGSMTITAYDPSAPTNSATTTLALTIDAPPLVVSMPAPGPARVGTPFSLTPSVSGAMGSVAWSVASGALPVGLLVDATSGAISGVPGAWGSATAVIQAQDSWSVARVDSKAVTITVAPMALTITTASLPPAIYQTMYTAMLNVAGGTGSTTWSLAGGALPSGVTLNPSGTISGVPSATGTFPITVAAVDANWPANTASTALTLVVSAQPLTLTMPPPPMGHVGTMYQYSGAASGQIGTLIWTIASGSLPPGVSLSSSSGAILGIPTIAGSFTSTVQVRDSADSSRVASANVTIVVAPLQIAITTTSLPAAPLARAYSSALSFSGGSGATLWSVSAGTLPSGLSLSGSGVISGIPTAVGSFTFTVQAADTGWTGNVARQSLSIAVTSREIVMYATDATKITGTWSRVADTTAAGGVRVWNPDLGVPKLTTAFAAPTSYFELTFQAEAGVPYHLWMRGKADGNAYTNDSAFVQFSGTVDTSGGALYRIGTTSATVLSIEQGTAAGLSGWGWSDNAYDGFAAPLYFATTGPQTIRIQVREDGLSLDQIVLSASKYAASAPGLPKNDTTILPR
jgi:hypothetical protein